MPNRRTNPVAIAVAAVLGADALLHLYWATGATWPASDERSLSYGVLGYDVSFAPPVVLPLAVLLLTAAGVVLARVRLSLNHRWGKLLQLGTLAVGIGMAARGLAGIGWMMGLDVGAPDGSAFHWLNPIVYTPLCVALAVACLHIARSRTEDVARVR
ncbi:DUF3995 domain-containing protein [Phytoactinopolyspora endophytica]|uniref:DUF3995 domain-containing protein n=1 Tax=Phytoactinopolyspora endophytica TaxID=1642495 RepID=UPI00101D9CF0|nr:DUF3995 domain-containing protein [Phytoactinopolyspora endophytica]